MSLKDEINVAIASHSIWKSRLIKAIETGTLDVPQHTIAMDDHCAFGKWLLGNDIPAEIRNSTEYKNVKDLHARFHKVAAKVAELALSGHKVEADKFMAINGEYTTITTQLISDLAAWQKKLP